MAPPSAQWEGLVFTKGPGLDELLEPGMSLILLDRFYSEVYGDYVFLGYEVYAEDLELRRSDLVGLYTAATLLRNRPAVVVCGENPAACILALAASMVLDKAMEASRALDEAWKVISRAYPGSKAPVLPAPIVAALHGLEAARDAAGGTDRLAPLMSLGLTYEYGKGRIHYGDSVTWAASAGARGPTLLTVMLHFLVEGPGGPPSEILRLRLEAVGEENLLALLGPPAEEALAALRSYAKGSLEAEASALLALVEALGPSGDVVYVERRESELHAYCPSPSGVPSKDCVQAVGQAAKIAGEKKPLGIEAVRLRPEEPPLQQP